MPNVRTFANMSEAIARNLHRLDRSAFDCIVGIPRSGMFAASMISLLWQKPLATLDGYCAGIVSGRSGRPETLTGKRILLVDDSCNKGRAMRRAMSLLPKGTRATRLAIYGPYQLEDPYREVDIFFEELRGPRVFAWNMWKHIRLPRWAFDFDGVLCRDCEKSENDDGPLYARFLAEAEPLFMPERKIGHIVTSRLEKYRPQTEAWLSRHGIEYASLSMMDLPSKADRMAAMKAEGGRGGWKARKVNQLRSEGVEIEMMLESCPKQSRIIARDAGIPAFCTLSQEVFLP